jgi:hypothetical protein
VLLLLLQIHLLLEANLLVLLVLLVRQMLHLVLDRMLMGRMLMGRMLNLVLVRRIHRLVLPVLPVLRMD